MTRSLPPGLLLILGACGSAAKPATHEFNATRAFQYLEAQVRFGPRIPNTKVSAQSLQEVGDVALALVR